MGVGPLDALAESHGSLGREYEASLRILREARTIMDLETMEWDFGLAGVVYGWSGCWEETPFATLPATALPEVVPSRDRAIGSIRGVPLGSGEGTALRGVVVGPILENQ